MDGLYIILWIKASRIRTIGDAFKEQKLSISNKPLVKFWAKWFPEILKWIQFGVEVVWIYRFNTMFVTVGNLTGRYLLLFPTKKVFCLRCLGIFLVEDLQVLILVSSNDVHISTYVNLESKFWSQRIADSKSTPMKYFLDSDSLIKFLIQTCQMFFHLW